VTTTFHFCLSISGALRNWRKRDWESLAISNGTTAARIKEKFRIWDFEGKKVLPIGEACEGFSDQTGCPGHPQQETKGTE